MWRRSIMTLFALSLVLVSFARAETVPIMRVIEAPGFTRDQIFNGAKTWASSNLKSQKAILELQDPAAGTLVANGRIRYPCEGWGCLGVQHWVVDFQMKVEAKDGKFRETFSGILISVTQGAYAFKDKPARDQDIEAVRDTLLRYGDEILKSLSQKIAGDDF